MARKSVSITLIDLTHLDLCGRLASCRRVALFLFLFLPTAIVEAIKKRLEAELKRIKPSRDTGDPKVIE